MPTSADIGDYLVRLKVTFFDIRRGPISKVECIQIFKEYNIVAIKIPDIYEIYRNTQRRIIKFNGKLKNPDNSTHLCA